MVFAFPLQSSRGLEDIERSFIRSSKQIQLRIIFFFLKPVVLLSLFSTKGIKFPMHFCSHFQFVCFDALFDLSCVYGSEEPVNHCNYKSVKTGRSKSVLLSLTSDVVVVEGINIYH